MAPIIIIICSVGAYAVNQSLFDVGLMLVFGAFGYMFKKLGYPIAPLVLAAVLGDKAEDAFRQSMLFSGGKLSIFWHNGLSGTLTTVGLAMACLPLIMRVCRRARA
jgi:TctA family transporter